ncbi:putative condensin-2 complex subunit G2 [Planoprotostelium fungivorum]|uniref:Putative condensin-2 complex subunit G2 n=1 Tax=Planoprotostelium fungivorum TaxID=1890364 RepID=A0A2P6NWC3_9EUKA|nr:putative condensin-2 complex subunit G2 [Planoprotostelium fungivorum]
MAGTRGRTSKTKKATAAPKKKVTKTKQKKNEVEDKENEAPQKPYKRSPLLDLFQTEEECVEELTHYLKERNNKEGKQELEEHLQVLNQSEITRIFTSLLNRLTNTEEDEENPSAFLRSYQSIATFTLAFLKNEKRVAPSSVKNVAQLLHDNIFRLQEDWMTDSDAKLNTEVNTTVNLFSCVSECWWSQNRPQREHLTPQTVSYLLFRAADLKSKANDVTRLYNLREALSLFDLDDESSLGIRKLLLKCYMLPVVLKSTKGKALLSYLFSISPMFIEEIHEMIRSQLPHCRKSIQKIYGEIYLEAWKEAEGATLIKIEHSCIQELMSLGIHTADNNASEACRSILSVFHKNKNVNGIDEMLHRLYAPILWRALRVANPLVRRNATCVLVDAFPLQDPTASAADIDEGMQKQFTLLQELLYDDSVAVRAAMIHGVSRVLMVWWELIPEASVRVLLTHLLGKLAHDKSSPVVRAAVLEGVTYMLENHMSHQILRALLPNIADLINDSCETVRLAFVELLHTIKNIKSIKFYEVIEPEQLIARLQKEKSVVAKKISSLLINSFCPYNQPTSVLIKRCLALIRSSPTSAMSFYNQAVEVLPVSVISKISAAIYRFVTMNKHFFASGEEEMEVTPSEGVCLMEISAILFHTIRVQLDTEENGPFLRFMEEVFTDDSLLDVIVYVDGCDLPPAEKSRVNVSLFSIASQLSSDSLPKFTRYVLSHVQKSTERTKKDQTENKPELLSAMRCLFEWGETRKMMNMINGYLGRMNEAASGLDGNARSKQSVSAMSKAVAAATSALSLLDVVMCDETCRTHMMSDDDGVHVGNVMGNLQGCLVMIEGRLAGREVPDVDVDDVVVDCVKYYCKLITHLSASSGMEKNEALLGLVEWTKDVVAPAVADVSDHSEEVIEEEQTKGKRKRTTASLSAALAETPLACRVAHIVVVTLCDIVALQLCGAEELMVAVNDIVRPFMTCRDARFLRAFVPNVFRLVFHTYSLRSAEEAGNLFSFMMSHIPEVIYNEAQDPQVLRLNELLQTLANQNEAVVFVSKLLPMIDTIMPEAEEQEDEAGVKLVDFDQLPSKGRYIFSSICRSAGSVSALADSMSQALIERNYDSMAMENAVKIAYLVVDAQQEQHREGEENRPTKRADLSSLCNPLITIVAKIPNHSVDVRKQNLKKYANRIMKSVLRSNQKESNSMEKS